MLYLFANLFNHSDVFEVEINLLLWLYEVPNNVECFGFDADRYFIFVGTTFFNICLLNAEIELIFVLSRAVECYNYDIFIIPLYNEFNFTQFKFSFLRIDVSKINFEWNLARGFNFDLSGQVLV